MIKKKMKKKFRNYIEPLPYLEEIIKPKCELKMIGKELIPSHRSRSQEVFRYICNDSRTSECPYGVVRKDKRICLYKK